MKTAAKEALGAVGGIEPPLAHTVKSERSLQNK